MSRAPRLKIVEPSGVPVPLIGGLGPLPVLQPPPPRPVAAPVAESKTALDQVVPSLGSVSDYPRGWEFIFQWARQPDIPLIATFNVDTKIAADAKSMRRVTAPWRLRDPGARARERDGGVYVDNTGEIITDYSDTWVKHRDTIYATQISSNRIALDLPTKPHEGQTVNSLAGTLVYRGKYWYFTQPLGEGKLDLERKSYDPIVRYNVPDSERKFVKNDPLTTFDQDTMCLPKYHVDIISLEDLNSYRDTPEVLYVDEQKRCWHIESMLERWEQGFSVYDQQSYRVTPQYPSDIDGAPMEPIVLRSILVAAYERGIDITKYPLLNILLRAGTICEQLYEFIIRYRELTMAFDQVIAEHPKDLSAANRRDIIAATWIEMIYALNKLPNQGYRKYGDIDSSPTEDGTQVFYSCVLVTLFTQHGYRARYEKMVSKYLEDTDIVASKRVRAGTSADTIPEGLHWVYAPSGRSQEVYYQGNTSKPRELARACVRYRCIVYDRS